MQRVQRLDHQIAVLVQQLPQQRLQLTAQTRTVLQAVRGKLSSPAALAVATISGALVGWGLYHRDHPTAPSSTTNKLNSSVVAWLRRGLWAGLMAYLVRKTV